KQTIDLRRDRGFAAAQQVGMADTGRAEMDAIRAEVVQIEEAEHALLTRQRADIDSSTQNAVNLLALLGLVNFALLGLAFYLVRRDVPNRAQSEVSRLRTTLASIGDAVIVTDSAGRVTFLNPV